jgi:hypothetical protein
LDAEIDRRDVDAKTEEPAFASSSALVYCIAEMSVLRILLPQAILNRFDGMNRLDIIGSV